MAPPPRLYFLVAARAPVAAVFRRGPTGWWQVSRWNLETGALEPGAWFHGTIYPRRSDVSPDGTLLLSFLFKRQRPGFLDANPPAWPDSYVTVSRLPWLFALAAWREGTTWGRGYCFVERAGTATPFALGDPGAGNAGPLRRRFGVERYPVVQYAAERRRGWVEHPESPGRESGGPWDERRAAVLVKPAPGRRPERLVLRDGGRGARRGIEGRTPTYALERRRRMVELPGVVCADWSPAGLLVMATDAGRLELREARTMRAVHSVDVTGQRPSPRPAPGVARGW